MIELCNQSCNCILAKTSSKIYFQPTNKPFSSTLTLNPILNK